jgi:two-component system cell cycle response regulator
MTRVASADDSPNAGETVTTQIRPSLAAIAPRVLLVDDDEIVIERLSDLISAAGFEVATATSGEAALAELDREFAQVVILDRNMPGMDGIELTRAIRSRKRYPGYVYIMLCTAHDSEEEILSGLDAGADDYISKRASGTQLIARLSTARRILSLEHSLKVVIEERQKMAMTDSLTGVHNRRYFMSHLGREVKRGRRYGGAVALLVFDIDLFKKVNDRHGHAVGDTVLVEFARRIQAALPRGCDWCARVGGEEFAAVLPQTDLAGGQVVAERIRRAVGTQPISTHDGMVEVTVSIGVTGLEVFANPADATVEQLLRRADDCLYRSKHAGRDRITVDAVASVPSA